ncbi:hypothetical protein LPJ53_002092 [Coemansia erecta]|uniref:F-box domain-containing protein n=1 Tax=Coemansia erecta TaxID=147472 RepID=A0A9W7XYT5_9FUNG|nr:hypothetical protein LPJ53_002092 [Coemansia erecta]
MSTDKAADTREQFDIITRLPFDLAVMVARHLSTRDMFECSQVSHSWNHVFLHDSIVMPLIQQMSHFDQEPIMFQTLPNGHEKDPDEALSNESTEEEKDKEKVRVVEGYANQQWLKNREVLLRILQKLLNRDLRWRRGNPTTRTYLPPVPLDGTDQDIRDEWQGSVRMLKMKGGIVAALYTTGKTLRMWRLDTEFDEVKAITDAYINDNRAALEAQTKYGGPPLPSFTDEQISKLLRISQSGQARHAVANVVRLRKPAKLFDFFIMSTTLATASNDNEVDVYDFRTGQRRHTLKVEGTEPIGSLHVWMDFVVVGHGTRITLWNHKTGAMIENALATAHNAPISGVFVLDNDSHLMSIDAAGFMVITDRSAEAPKDDTLLDVPMYPMIMAGQMGAPYMMRLLHASHLCVWGKYSLGHYELYEPGLANLPPLGSLVMTPRDEAAGLDDGHAEDGFADIPPASGFMTASAVDEPSATDVSGSNDPNEEPRKVLKQLEATHHEMELMYRDMAGDRDGLFPDGYRIERHRKNKTTAEQRYHVINIDSPFNETPEGEVVCVDFRRALFIQGSALDIYEVDKHHDEQVVGVPLGLFPTDPLEGIELPPAPPSPKKKQSASDDDEWMTEDDDDDDDGDGDEDDESVDEHVHTEPANYADGVRNALEELDMHTGMWNTDEVAEYNDFLQRVGIGNQHQHQHQHHHHHHHHHGNDPHAAQPGHANHIQIPLASDLHSGSEYAQIEAIAMRCIITLGMSIDSPDFLSKRRGGSQAKSRFVEESRLFLSKHMPEIFAACHARVEPNVLLTAAPFYIQRLYESRFKAQTHTVDHRGQVVSGSQITRDMRRVGRAIGMSHEDRWTQKKDFVPEMALHLTHTAAAMDDSRVAVGCENGYIVVTSYD